MTKELYEALESLCWMWEQYCSGDWGHMHMSAGEGAMDVLEKYGLFESTNGVSGEINWKVLDGYRNILLMTDQLAKGEIK